MRLSRADVPDLLARVPATALPTLGAALVLDDWSTEPPCGLRRQRDALLARFAACDAALLAELDAALTSQAVTEARVADSVGFRRLPPYTEEVLHACWESSSLRP